MNTRLNGHPPSALFVQYNVFVFVLPIIKVICVHNT